MRHGILAFILLAGATAPWVHAAPVRMFAVGHKQHLTDAVTYQAYHDKMAAMMDGAFPGRATLVQAGVDDVASHLAPADPSAPRNALVVFPEDTGLLAAFIGTRGTTARTQTVSTLAIVSLFGTYGPQIAYYQAKFPGQPPVRYLVLALTDTFYRAVYETFRELAMTHGVYLAVGTNMAPARRVDEADDPDIVGQLRDPDEPGRTYAYEAVAAFTPNTTVVFAPDGEILVADGSGGTRRAPSETGGVLSGSTSKAYLVPIEEPPPGNDAGLSLSFNPVHDQEVIDTPVGRLAIVISKDAWMVDVNDRYVAKGANVILQPEAFDSWAFTTSEWSPDVFREGGFANLQKNPEWVVNVDPDLTGNLFDITFDGQTSIIGRKHKADAGPLTGDNAWIGQNPDTALRAVGPWIAPDPGIADPTLSLAARRAALAADGVALRPGNAIPIPCPTPLSADACENGYRESVVWADVDVPTTATTSAPDPTRELPPMFGAAVRASGPEGSPVAQHTPRIAARGRHVYVVWSEDVGKGSAIRLAVSHDAGLTFQPSVPVSANLPGSVNELNPAIAVRGGRVLVVWQEFASLGNDDAGRIVMARFSGRPKKLAFDVRVDDLDASGKWMPSIAFVGSKPIVAWIDERDSGPEGEALEHVYAARGFSGGLAFGPAVRVDTGTPVPLAAHVDNKWAPSIAANKKQVLVAWADFRNYAWEIFSARSVDGGISWGSNVRVDDASTLVERIHERPSVAIARNGTVHAAWTDLRLREPDTNVYYARSTDLGTTFGPNTQIDGSATGFDPDTDTPSNQWSPSIAVDDGQVFVTWQDNRLGNDDVFFTRSIDGGQHFQPAERVDDTGTGSSEQTRPSLAIGGRGSKRTCYAAWEDDRNGDRDVYVAARPCGN
jgi:hypothetical protein